MNKSRFSEEQMVTILREADRITVAETAKKHKISDATIYAWRKHFGQMELSLPRREPSLQRSSDRANSVHRQTGKPSAVWTRW